MQMAQATLTDVPPKYRDADPSDLDPSERRTHKAYNEPMVVIPEATDDGIALGLYTVHSTSGREYFVDSDTGACECPDAKFNAPEGGCKHARRVKIGIINGELPDEGEDATAYLDALDDMAAGLASKRDRLQSRIDDIETLIAALD